MKTEEHTEPSENVEENILVTFKPFLLGVAGLGFVMGILVLLPMLMTYVSEGNLRPPSQIHPADPIGKTDHTIYKPMKNKKQ